jgi:NAD(P)H dehydrogenase (quinone)
MVGAALPEPVAKLIASFDMNTAAERASKVTGDFKAITGVEPPRFTDWLSANKTALLGA